MRWVSPMVSCVPSTWRLWSIHLWLHPLPSVWLLLMLWSPVVLNDQILRNLWSLEKRFRFALCLSRVQLWTSSKRKPFQILVWTWFFLERLNVFLQNLGNQFFYGMQSLGWAWTFAANCTAFGKCPWTFVGRWEGKDRRCRQSGQWGVLVLNINRFSDMFLNVFCPYFWMFSWRQFF